MIVDHRYGPDQVESLVSLTRRVHPGGRKRFERIEAKDGKIELVAWLGQYEAHFDLTPDEAYEVAEKLVEMAEVATVQCEEAKRKRAEEEQRRQSTLDATRAKRLARSRSSQKKRGQDV